MSDRSIPCGATCAGKCTVRFSPEFGTVNIACAECRFDLRMTESNYLQALAFLVRSELPERADLLERAAAANKRAER